jgi:hypothetical protein
MSGVYQCLLSESYRDPKSPWLSDPKNLSPDPCLETSKADFLCLLHHIASTPQGSPEESAHLTIGHSAENKEAGNRQISIGASPSQSEQQEEAVVAHRTKRSVSSLSGLFSSKFDRVQYDLDLTLTTATATRQPPPPPPPSSTPQGVDQVVTGTPHSQLLTELLTFLQTDINGKSLRDLTSHFIDERTGVSASSVSVSVVMVQEALLLGCRSGQILRYPFFDSLYRGTVRYVHHSFSQCYYGRTKGPQDGEGEREGEGTVGSIDRLETIPVPQMELTCPWMTCDGKRNEKIFSLFASKVMATVTMKPSCPITVIHGDLPMLSCSHVAILLMVLVEEGILLQRKVPRCCSLRLQSPFHSHSYSSLMAQGQEEGEGEQSPPSLTRYSFSLNPKLWLGEAEAEGVTLSH